MLELKLDMVPFGDESQRRNIGTFKIVNTGLHKNRPDYGNYIVFTDKGDFKINNHLRTDGAWKLVFNCIKKYLRIKEK